jgi:putative zinc finger/helix-turn-helix YgiT family protein
MPTNLEAETRGATVDVECPSCESNDVVLKYENQKFDYNNGALVSLSVTVPVNFCQNPECREAFLGEQAMKIRHDAICTHLGLLTPSTIQEIRMRKATTVEAFASITGIGIATIRRWESGSIFQSKSQDNFLRLLAREDNFAFLSTAKTSRVEQNVEEKRKDKFPAIAENKLNSLRSQQQVFQLHQRRAA